jgi:hypothetical protein
MKYAFLIYDDPSSWESLPPEEAQKLRTQVMPDWEVAMGELAKVDPDFTGYELENRSKAKVVRVRDGERIVTDGPFAETKEQLGGFYILDCDDLDEAIAYARKIPAAEHGSVEVRPVWEVPVRA